MSKTLIEIISGRPAQPALAAPQLPAAGKFHLYCPVTEVVAGESFDVNLVH